MSLSNYYSLLLATIHDLSHTIRDYSGVLVLFATIRYSVFPDIYLDQATIQDRRGDCSEAYKSEKRVLDIRLRLFGAGVTQHSLGDYISVLEPKKHIRRKLFGEEHSETADSYLSVAATQHPVGDYNSALESKKDALEIRRKLFGEHQLTTNNNHEVRVTQHSLGDYTSALYDKCSLDIILRMFGEKQPTTTCSYHSVGLTQHSLADQYMSALKSKKRAHSQHSLGNYHLHFVVQ